MRVSSAWCWPNHSILTQWGCPQLDADQVTVFLANEGVLNLTLTTSWERGWGFSWTGMPHGGWPLHLNSEKPHPGEGCQTGRVWRGMEAEIRVQEGRMGRRWLLCGQVLEEHMGLKIHLQPFWRVWYITLNSGSFSEGSFIIPFTVSKYFDWIGMINPRRWCELPILVLRQMYFCCYFCVSFYFISPVVVCRFYWMKLNC